jgi:hypothetical protein
VSFVKQVFGLARTAIPVAIVVVTPVVFVVRGPVNLLSEVARYASKPGGLPQLATLGEPVSRLAIAGFASVVGAILTGWMARVFIETFEQEILEQPQEPTRTYSVAWGAVTSLLYVLSVLTGLTMLLIPGLVLLVRGPLSVSVSVSERVGPWRALSRSWHLTKGRHMPIQGILWLLLLAAVVGGLGLFGLAFWIPGANTNLGRSILMTIANALGWSSILATLSAAYVLLAGEEKLGYLPARPAAVAKRHARASGRSRARFLLYAAGLACLSIAVWMAVGPGEKDSEPAAEPASDFAAEVEALLRNPAKGIETKQPVVMLPLPAPVGHPPPRQQPEWKPRPMVGTTGHLAGRLVDEDGIPVPGAEVEVILEDGWTPDRLTDPPVLGTTDEAGAFRIGPVPSGSYTVRVVDATERYQGFGSRPVTGVKVGTGDSAPAVLELEPYVSVQLHRPAANTTYLRKRHFVHDGLHPLVNGFSLGRTPFDRRESTLTVKTLPGPLRFSPDPCFHPAADVYSFEVGADGSVRGTASLPRSASARTRIRVTRSDGRPLSRGLIRVVPACTPPGSGATSYELGGDLGVDHRTWLLGRQGYHNVRMSHGMAWRVLAVDSGSRVTESEPFVAGRGDASVSIVLESAPAARVTFELTGLPDAVSAELGPEDFEIALVSDRGLFVDAPPGWNVKRSSDGVMSFEALPEGEKALIRFSHHTSVHLEASAEITIEEGAHFELEVTEVNPAGVPRRWAGRWWSGVEVGSATWNLSVAPPPWLVADGADSPSDE